MTEDELLKQYRALPPDLQAKARAEVHQLLERQKTQGK